jgi:hypothetical protein
MMKTKGYDRKVESESGDVYFMKRRRWTRDP